MQEAILLLMIYSTTKMPITYLILSADVKLYARDSDIVWGPCDKVLFSARYTYRR